ncbi:hypothetical protein K504DRAFT_530790 [Pleomassaria siparia CBS 279.74]|uniref:Secreted protein n=1 Tax=Pleomassaria siparia CBS 279.74 TaxID=1314801 RepID=A0A6G1KM15_9PLEO|nr:hypothetical protein K504DRAFT_530790 [Pleomassaria siparia CBS 279.74]
MVIFRLVFFFITSPVQPHQASTKSFLLLQAVVITAVSLASKLPCGIAFPVSELFIKGPRKRGASRPIFQIWFLRSGEQVVQDLLGIFRPRPISWSSSSGSQSVHVIKAVIVRGKFDQ